VTYRLLGKAYYQYGHDPTLRAAVLFGHGENFPRGIDVDAYQVLAASGCPLTSDAEGIDPLATRRSRLSKPLVVVVHGDTFGQDENTQGRFPGGGATVRFVRDAGWANAMRYMPTGDHWSAEEALRMGIVHMIVATPDGALQAGVAKQIAACGPLGIKATLASAHLAIDASEAEAFANLEPQYRALYASEDIKEGRRAEAEGRTPNYQG
jgi:enoyl-CoA hydratase/carnithine racemase